ncbi:DMT family transporter [Asanoa iriomotensis]|uniref:Membrane protein n=1 Tax=Asanoa iriomotensis TaxID=234613 RepID=A0ABQ4C5N6_9ACTN|nr:DMT family transporter [Asanoa iriomotensis]GIF58101.1 membrane protein [Asanoa iriomotensis]
MRSNTTLPVGRGILYILLAAVAWGTGGAVAAVLYATTGLGPLAVSFWRFAGGVLLLGVAHLLTRRRTAPRRARWHHVVITGAGLAVYQTAYFAAVAYAGLAVATVVTLGAGPVLIALGARATMGERLGRSGATTVGLALLGLTLLVGGGGATTGPAPTLGLACALLSAAGYAVVTLLTRKLGHDGRPTPTTLGGFTVGLVCLLPLALVEGPLPATGHLTTTAGLLAYLALVPTALAYTLFFAGLSTVRATTASVIALIEPLTATVIAVLWLDEHLTPTAAAGSVVLTAAVLALTRTERRTSSNQPTPHTERTLAPTHLS